MKTDFNFLDEPAIKASIDPWLGTKDRAYLAMSSKRKPYSVPDGREPGSGYIQLPQQEENYIIEKENQRKQKCRQLGQTIGEFTIEELKDEIVRLLVNEQKSFDIDNVLNWNIKKGFDNVPDMPERFYKPLLAVDNADNAKEQLEHDLDIYKLMNGVAFSMTADNDEDFELTDEMKEQEDEFEFNYLANIYYAIHDCTPSDNMRGGKRTNKKHKKCTRKLKKRKSRKTRKPRKLSRRRHNTMRKK